MAHGCARPQVYHGDVEEARRVLAAADIDVVSVVMASHVQPVFVRAALAAGVGPPSPRPLVQ